MPLDMIGKADVLRWRDSITENGEGSFNRTITILSAMLKYAEQLGYRKRGSNPCRGIARFARVLPERYLTAGEYWRLARRGLCPGFTAHSGELPSRFAPCHIGLTVPFPGISP